MKPWLTKLKNMPHSIALLVIMIGLYGIYFYYAYKPVTNNAFVVANIRPVTAQVSGLIDKIYVQNEQFVRRGKKLFSIDQTPYRLKYDTLANQIKINLAKLEGLRKSIVNHKKQLSLQQSKIDLINQNLNKLSDASDQTKTSDYFELKKAQLEQQIIILQKQQVITETKSLLKQQKTIIKNSTLQLNQAEYDLANTTVIAKTDGIVSNLFLAVGSPVKAYSPIFSFIDTSQYWIQANFQETEIGNLKLHQKAKVTLRLSGKGKEMYQGEVFSLNWAVDRQLTNQFTYLPMVENENQWTLLPQRFPVLIRLMNVDKNNPPPVGASAYVDLL